MLCTVFTNEPPSEASFMSINTIPNGLESTSSSPSCKPFWGRAWTLPCQPDRRNRGRLLSEAHGRWSGPSGGGGAREQRGRKSTKCLFQASWPSSPLADGTLRQSTEDAEEETSTRGAGREFNAAEAASYERNGQRRRSTQRTGCGRYKVRLLRRGAGVF